MPIYFFWGEDDFAIAQAVKKLQEQILDSSWLQFNYHKLSGDLQLNIIEGLNQAMTPPFGIGGRLVWIAQTTICQSCSEELLSELQRTLPVIADNSHLLFTSSKKPDARLKSSKILKEYAQIKEFSLIPPWKFPDLVEQVKQIARDLDLKLTPDAIEFLAESIGNNTRQLWQELEKLSLYSQDIDRTIDLGEVSSLVIANKQNSFQLATAIINGNTSIALKLIDNLINHNEPALKIVAILVNQFRTWTLVKLMLESGENQEKIATVAEIGNPNRIYPLRKEIERLSSQQLLACLPILLDLELSLKTGSEPLSTLQIKVLEICSLFSEFDRANSAI